MKKGLYCVLGLFVLVVGCDPRLESVEGRYEQQQRAELLGNLNYGCSTQGTEGVSLQLLGEMQCLTGGAFEEVTHPNVVPTHSRVHLFFAAQTKTALENAADVSPPIQVTSGFRTLAEQYALWNSGACGLAAQPGSSAHESGRAIDVQNYSDLAVRNALLDAGFSWPYPSSDPVHFSGPGTDMDYYSVLAFQRLWNANNPGDLIDEDGIVGPQTLARLAMTPGEGFPIGAVCTADPPDLYLDLTIDSIDGQERDLCTLSGSEGVFDAYRGQVVVQRLMVTNEGASVAREVWVDVEVGDPAFHVDLYEIYDNWYTNTCGEEFCLNDTNDHPNNPPHDSAGNVFSLYLGQISPDETKMVVLDLTASADTFAATETADVRFWVGEIQDYYSKDTFDGPFDNVDDSQTFNGGDLRMESRATILMENEVCGNGADDDCNGEAEEGCVGPDVDGGVGGDGGTSGDAGGEEADGGGSRSGTTWGGCSCTVGSRRGGSDIPLLLLLVLALGWVVLIRRGSLPRPVCARRPTALRRNGPRY